jgi:hypothetical protein
MRLVQLREKVQEMSKNHVEELHELFGEELPSQGVKPKALIEGIISNH